METQNGNGDSIISESSQITIEICIDGKKYIVKEQPIATDSQVVIHNVLKNLGEHVIFTDKIEVLLAERLTKVDCNEYGLHADEKEDVTIEEETVYNGGDVVMDKHNAAVDVEFVEIQDAIVSIENSPEESVGCISDGRVKKGMKSNIDGEICEKNPLIGNIPSNLHSCEYCKKTFQKRRSFLRHVLTHTGEKPFACDVCGKGFSQGGHLKVHQRIHSEEKKFSCDICSKKFFVNSNLTTHKRIHSGEKPYKCEVCGMNFNQISSMKVHRRSHSGEKPFSCDKCGKRFTRYESLRYHQNTHMESSRFECEICKKRFASSTYLKRHLSSHSSKKEFECIFCSRAFSLEANLKIHLRLHTGERPYSCTVCNDKFIHSQTLRKHLQIHEVTEKKSCDKCGLLVTQSCKAKKHTCSVKEKPHVCQHCGKSFDKLYGLKRHIQSHTSDAKLVCEVCGKTYRRNESLKVHMKVHDAFLKERSMNESRRVENNSIDDHCPPEFEAQNKVNILQR